MKEYNRLEVIGPDGRELIFYGAVTAEEQDEGRTLKVFKGFNWRKT